MSVARPGWMLVLLALVALALGSCGDQKVTGQVPQVLVSVSCTHPLSGDPSAAVSDTPWVELLDRPDLPTLGVTEFNVVAGGHSVPGHMVFQRLPRTRTTDCGNEGQPPCDCSVWQIAYIADAPLSGHTAHTATITTGVRLVGGQLVRDSFTWSFTTGDSGVGPHPSLATASAR